MPSNHLILCRPLLLLPSIFLSTRVFSNESALRTRWPKYCKDQTLESHHEEMLGTCYKKTGTCSKISRSGNIMKDWLKGYPRFSSVQFHSVTQSCPTLCNPMNPPGQASISITHSRSSPILMSIELVMPSNHLILCRPLLSFQTSGSFQMSQLFSHQVAKILKFQLQHQSFQWTPRTDLL